MIYAVLAFVSAFVLIMSAGHYLTDRWTLHKRVGTILPRSGNSPWSRLLTRGHSGLIALLEFVQRAVPRTDTEASRITLQLIRAGYRSDSAVKVFYAAKCLLPVALCLGTSMLHVKPPTVYLLYTALVVLGYLSPDFWLDHRIKARQGRIRRGIPDALDLLVICLEAGLGMDDATARTAREIKNAHRVLSRELELVVLEQHAGRPRSEAWRNMAERTGVEQLRNIVSILAQAEKYGTSIANTLRTHADTIRTRRVQDVEEMAAKTTIQLIFPLVLFIFPALFLVILGPAVILISEQFMTLGK